MTVVDGSESGQYHAALVIEYVLEWITLDQGFSRYPNLRWARP